MILSDNVEENYFNKYLRVNLFILTMQVYILYIVREALNCFVLQWPRNVTINDRCLLKYISEKPAALETVSIDKTRLNTHTSFENIQKFNLNIGWQMMPFTIQTGLTVFIAQIYSTGITLIFIRGHNGENRGKLLIKTHLCNSLLNFMPVNMTSSLNLMIPRIHSILTYSYFT